MWLAPDLEHGSILAAVDEPADPDPLRAVLRHSLCRHGPTLGAAIPYLVRSERSGSMAFAEKTRVGAHSTATLARTGILDRRSLFRASSPDHLAESGILG